jgi:hypothetical protein
MSLILLLACAEPFDVSRSDLGPFRIAAVGVEGGIARAEVWSGVGMGHASSPTLDWSLDGQPLGTGFDVAIPGPGQLSLVATSVEGEVAEAVVTVAEPPARLSFERLAVQAGQDLGREHRLEWAEEPLSGSVEADGVVRFRVLGSEFSDAVHWMTAGGHGSLLELEAASGDAFASEIVFSEEQELLERDELGPTLTHHLALALDGQGGNDWIWMDAAFGLDGPFLRHRGRLLPVEGSFEPGLVALTAQVTNDLGALSFTDGVQVSDLAEQDALDCLPPEQALELELVTSGRCGLDELDGARVVLEVW